MQGIYLRKYGVTTTIDFQLYQPDGVDLESAATFAAGDVVIMTNEGAEANTTNLPVDEGLGYSLALTAAEMQGARIVVYVVDQTATKVWLDTALVIETYGSASAQHAFDLDTAEQSVDVAKINTNATAAARLAAAAATIVSGAATATTLTTTQMSTNLAEATNDHYKNRVVIWTSGALIDQAALITAYDGSTKTLTYETVTEAPANGDGFIIV